MSLRPPCQCCTLIINTANTGSFTVRPPLLPDNRAFDKYLKSLIGTSSFYPLGPELFAFWVTSCHCQSCVTCPLGRTLFHSPPLRPTSWSRPIAPWAHSHLMGLLPSPMPQALCVTSPRSFWHLGPGFPGVRCHICLPNPASMGLVYPTTRTCSAIPVLWHIKVITEVSQMNRAKRGILQIQNKYPMSIANEY